VKSRKELTTVLKKDQLDENGKTQGYKTEWPETLKESPNLKGSKGRKIVKIGGDY